METRATRIGLVVWTTLVVLFLWLPLVLIGVYAFNKSNIQSWPFPGWTTHWFSEAWHNSEVRSSLYLSLKVGLLATGFALVLGSMAAFAIHRFRFFGRESVSFLLLLPIALPGIVTGIALSNAITTTLEPIGVQLCMIPVILGHATFCVVVVYNNVLARLRRTGTSLEDASMDLGAGVFQTFRYITFPAVRSALIAGALLAFALSFDEIIVTTFTAGASVQTLPLWIFTNLARPNQAPVVTVVAAVLIVVSIFPVWLAQRVSSDTAGGRL